MNMLHSKDAISATANAMKITLVASPDELNQMYCYKLLPVTSNIHCASIQKEHFRMAGQAENMSHKNANQIQVRMYN